MGQRGVQGDRKWEPQQHDMQNAMLGEKKQGAVDSYSDKGKADEQKQKLPSPLTIQTPKFMLLS